MMKTEYRREMNRNYMVIHPEPGYQESYGIRMLGRNKISGLLPFQEKQMDGMVSFYYDITSKQPLDRILGKRSLTADELRGLISELLLTLRQMERFLLDEGELCLEPEYIYVEPDSFRVHYCLIPGKWRAFDVQFRELAQYLLDHVDPYDGETVVLAFSVVRECRKENFGMDDIEKVLQAHGGSAGKGTSGEDRIPAVTKTEPIPLEAMDRIRCADAAESEDFTEDETDRRDLPLKRILLCGILGLMVLIPLAIVLLMGLPRLLQWMKGILACEIVSAVTVILILRWRPPDDRDDEEEKDKGNRNTGKKINSPGKHSKDFSEESEADIWKVYFRDDDEDEIETDDFKEPYDGRRGGGALQSAADEAMQTVLLTSLPVSEESRMLVPLNGGPQIIVGYYPFLIGKSRDLSDFYLSREGVSRLHVKLEQKNDRYFVTDLNSTNGTKVDGALLEANETVELPIGVELTIANLRYRFQ